MLNIDNELSQINSSIYGTEMRKAIYDAMNKFRNSGFIGYNSTLASNDLFANLTEPGVYGVSNEVAAQITDSPVDMGGTLIVMRANANATVTQVYYCTNGSIYWRQGVSNSFIEINLEGFIKYRSTLTPSDLFANLTEPGVYGVSNEVAAQINDSPVSRGGTLFVMRASDIASVTQVYYCTNGSIYWRQGVANSFIEINLEGFIKYRSTLTPSDLFANLTEPGVYGVSNEVASQINDSPVSRGGTLFVMRANANATVTQVYYCTNGSIYWRQGVSNSFIEINPNNIISAIQTSINESGFIGYKNNLTSSDLFANLTEPGVYGVSNEIAAQINDSPVSRGGTLFVMRANEDSTVTQIYYCTNGSIYWRQGVSNGFIEINLKGFIGYKNILTSNDLFANLTDPGVYGASNSVAAQITDSPVSVGGTLFVMRANANATVTQVYYCTNGSIYWRQGVSNSFIEINPNNIISAIQASINESGFIGYKNNLTSSDLFANLTEPGVYGISTSVAAQISDSPITRGGTLFVMRANANATVTQVYYCTNGSIYWRQGVSNSFIEINPNKDVTPYLEENEYFVHTCVDKPIEINENTGLYIFGDSIASNTSHGNFSWGSLIAQKMGCTEYNFAVGSSAYVHNDFEDLRIIDQINSVSDWSKCTLCIVAAGTNDANYNTTSTNLRAAVQTVIDSIKQNAPNAKLVFITPMQRAQEGHNRKLPKIAGTICNIALKNGCSVINGFDFPFAHTTNEWVDELTDNDGLHPSAQTKTIYARCVLNALL